MKMVRKKNMPNSAVPVHSMITYAPVRSLLLKMRSGISACLLRDSIRTNEARRTTAATRDTMTLGSPQWDWPLGLVAAEDRPYTRAARPTVPVIAPGRSNLPMSRLDSLSTRGASSTTTRPIGTLTKNTQRQDR